MTAPSIVAAAHRAIGRARACAAASPRDRRPLPFAQIRLTARASRSASAARRARRAHSADRPRAVRCRRRARRSRGARSPRGWRDLPRSAAPKSGVISGAVTKSPAAPSLRRARRVIAEARRVQRELHVAREREPAACARRSPARMCATTRSLCARASASGAAGRHRGEAHDAARRSVSERRTTLC